MKYRSIILLLTVLLFFNLNCNSQIKPENMKKINRQPAVAGQFYPANSDELKSTIEEMFLKAKKKTASNDVLAIISPHAGYVYSGEVAASVFNQIDNNKVYDKIFVIASSHRVSFSGASIYSKGNYITPLGEVKVNIKLANELIDKHSCFTFYKDAHTTEHSLEVQLPFLQYVIKKDFEIIPIIIGSQSIDMCKQLAKALKPYFNSDNLFVISSDFSHFPTYDDAAKIDKISADAILTNSPEKLTETIETNDTLNIPNLATSMCGWTSVLTMLYMTEKNPEIEMKLIQYMNSGDVSFGSKDRVVGYNGISVSLKNEKTMQTTSFSLSKTDKVELLKMARATIELYIKKNKVPKSDTTNLSETLKTNCGMFVTLHKKGKLRGCIGRFNPDIPLYELVKEMAISSATRDSRFQPVTQSELDEIDIEISVLTPMQKMKSIDELVLGKHGIYIKKDFHSGTFLPQVATETEWTKTEFLGHCSRDKAYLGWDGWKNADVYLYEALVFGEKDK